MKLSLPFETMKSAAKLTLYCIYTLMLTYMNILEWFYGVGCMSFSTLMTKLAQWYVNRHGLYLMYLIQSLGFLYGQNIFSVAITMSQSVENALLHCHIRMKALFILMTKTIVFLTVLLNHFQSLHVKSGIILSH